MPSHFCKYPSCGTIVQEYGCCNKHKSYCDKQDAERQKRYDATRDPIVVAFYNSKEWQATRANKLSLNPICEHCKRLMATECHHIDPVKANWNRRLDIDNLMSVCQACHKRIERRHGRN